MKIFFIRHGESEANVARYINDDPARAVNLTGQGRAQAEAASDELRTVRFTHAYASEFPRAQQTAKILLRHHACPLQIDARINERQTGMDGLPVETFRDLMRTDPLHTKPEHGESFLEQMERLRGFMDEIAARHPDGIIMAASHENPILAALALSTDNPEQTARGKIANCGWVEMDWPAE
ncbi:MAG: histidine phosphatase family protein [Nitrosomonadales bacterium]|nr:histidine phosphatase family protein [Nitrosomonadales bacterium]